MRKVIMYSTSELFGNRVTGGLKRFLELYYGLKLRGYQVEIYSADNESSLMDNDIEGISLNTTNINKNSLFPVEIKILLKNLDIIRKIKNDANATVIVFDVPTAFSLSLAGVKNIQLFIRQNLIEYKRISLYNRLTNKFLIETYLELLRYTELFCLLRAERVFVQCNYDLNELVNRHKIFGNVIKNKTKIKINNVNPSWVVNKSFDTIGGDDIPISKPLKNILFIGDFSNDRKGHKLFIEAIKSLIDKGYQIKATILGDGKLLEKSKEECKSYKEIKFKGRIDNSTDFINKSDLVVVPSLADSCPNTVLESLYNNIPVVGTNTGGIPEILIDSEALFNPDSTNLEKKIIEMMDPYTLVKVQAKQKKRKSELSFDWTDEIISLLET